MQLDIEKFSPTVAELQNLVSKSSAIQVSDLTDKQQLKVVKQSRIELRDARVAITKIGKGLREDAIAFQKAVIVKEKELVGIIEPEENRLKAIEEEAEKLAEFEKRRATLPRRLEVLQEAGLTLSEPEILAMDDNEFITYKNTKVEERNEQERQRLEAERRAVEEEKAKIEREKEMRDREEKARIDERARLEREAAAAEARAKTEAEAKEREAEKERARLDKEEKYRAFRTSHGWTEDTKADFKEERTAEGVVLWKKLGTFITN
jgi:flagellar biosynthesis GTPase FlhF